MMKHYTYNAFPKSYEYDADHGPIMLDLDEFEELVIIEMAGSYTVIDKQEDRLYSVEAASPAEAVEKYIDWVYGEMPIYEWDEEEEGYCSTYIKEWASTGYNIEPAEQMAMEVIEER